MENLILLVLVVVNERTLIVVIVTPFSNTSVPDALSKSSRFLRCPHGMVVHPHPRVFHAGATRQLSPLTSL